MSSVFRACRDMISTKFATNKANGRTLAGSPILGLGGRCGLAGAVTGHDVGGLAERPGTGNAGAVTGHDVGGLAERPGTGFATGHGLIQGAKGGDVEVELLGHGDLPVAHAKDFSVLANGALIEDYPKENPMSSVFRACRDMISTKFATNKANGRTLAGSPIIGLGGRPTILTCA